MIEDFPELFRPMRTVIGLKRTFTSSSKILKLESFSPVSTKYHPYKGITRRLSMPRSSTILTAIRRFSPGSKGRETAPR